MGRCPPRVQCRGVIPPLSYIMLHSDTLANEFNEILNAVEIFAPFQPLDPAVTFYAPLRNAVRDLRLSQDDFSRASDAWYLDGNGVYRNVGINRARFEQSRLLMEPAETNVNVNYNANPDAALSGLVAENVTVRRVLNAADLQAAGLQDICTSGFVFEVENETASVGFVYINGGTGASTTTWNVSGFINTFGNNVTLRLTGAPETLDFSTTRLERVQTPGTADGNSRVWQLTGIQPGARVQFVLNQLTDSPVVTSPIVTEGTAGQRAVDGLDWNAPGAFNAPQGMCIFNWVPHWSGSDYPSGLRRDSTLVTLRDTTPGLSGLCRLTHFTNNTISLETNDGSSTTALGINAGDLVAGRAYTLAVRWNNSPAQKQIGIRLAGGWDWSGVGGYDGSYLNDSIIRVADSPLYGQKMSDLEFWNEDRGTAWIEANYP